MLQTRLHITPYARRHRTALLQLCHYGQWTHQHLDWHSPAQWIDQPAAQIFLAWQAGQIAGYIGLSPVQDGAAWIRLLGIADGTIPSPIIRELWQAAQAQCRQRGASQVGLLMVANWLSVYLRQLGFRCVDDIITLDCTIAAGSEQSEHSAPPPARLQMRAATDDDLPHLAQIDRLAFPPLWRLTAEDLWQAYRLSASAAVAVQDGAPVGFQISTRHHEVGHLARLAVVPQHQRRHIGSALLRRLLHDFKQRGIRSVTVNTQHSNHPSQRLYQRHRFSRSGLDLEVWHRQLEQLG